MEADGGSRGNPGPAAYGALVRDDRSGDVLAQRGETIGVATNNVAEYRGLIAGLELAAEVAPDAAWEVRMDSKLVVEQMAGRWKIKHPDMKPLALRAQRLVAGRTVRWTWVPRAENTAADALVNAALDGAASGEVATGGDPTPPGAASMPAASTAPSAWRGGTATTLMLLRHGVTEATERKLFSGSGGEDPGLTETGRDQARRAAAWIGRRGGVDVLLTSPLRRARQTAAEVSEVLDGLAADVEHGMREADFGEWEGRSFADVRETWPEELTAWFGDAAAAPPGGESLGAVDARVAGTRERLLADFPGRTVVVVSHVTPIKALLRQALDVEMPAIHRLHLAPASLTTIDYWPDGDPIVRSFSVVPD